MRVLIRLPGPEGTTEHAVETPALTFGRGTQNDVELPGLMVALDHARLRLSAPGRYHVSSATGVEIGGRSGLRDADVKPGERIGISGHEVTIEAPKQGYDLIVSVRIRDEAPTRERTGAVLDLAAAGLRLRRPALLGALAVLLVGLALPLASRALSWRLPVFSDTQWSPGAMSLGHAHFDKNCGACHQQLFASVQDTACAACHAGVAHHIEPPIPNLPDPASGCSTCHREHRGPHGVTATAPTLCVDCHKQPGRFTDAPNMQAVSDFQHHPEFSLWMARADEKGQVREQRTPLAAGLKDTTLLAFPHELHLAAAGVRGPNGIQVLKCDACHKPDAGRTGFQPIRYEDGCKSCHKLSVVIGGRESELPHGDSDAVRRILEGLAAGGQYTAQAPASAANFDLRQRAGEGVERTANAGPSREDLIADVFEFRVCARCHQTERVENQPRVKRPKVRSWYFAGATFTHARHSAMDCGQCHEVAKSKSGDDLALPGIDSCRSCHADPDAGHGVPTPCASCHRFHRAVPATPVAATAPPASEKH